MIQLIASGENQRNSALDGINKYKQKTYVYEAMERLRILLEKNCTEDEYGEKMID